jgi:hypothetical protein
MPRMVEVDEEQLLRDQNLRKLVEKVMADPEAAVLVEQAVKKIDPNAKTPKLDARKAVVEPVDQLRKEMADFIKAQNEDREKRDAEAKRNDLKAKVEAGFAELRARGWMPDGIKKVEELMEQKGLLDPLDAADLYEKRNPPPAPTTPTGGGWNFPEIPTGADANSYEKALLDSKGQNDLIAERQAMEVLNEIRGARRN